MTTFTTEELTEIARKVDPGSPHRVERDGLRFTFGTEYDDRSVMEQVNDADCYGKLAWPVRDRYTGNERRPDGFTGAARKMGWDRDTIWWEPYRDEGKVYDSPEDCAFMADLIEYGFIGCVLTVERMCECCNRWDEIASESLWGIESPLVGRGNGDYLADVFADLLTEATVDA